MSDDQTMQIRPVGSRKLVLWCMQISDERRWQRKQTQTCGRRWSWNKESIINTIENRFLTAPHSGDWAGFHLRIFRHFFLNFYFSSAPFPFGQRNAGTRPSMFDWKSFPLDCFWKYDGHFPTGSSCCFALFGAVVFRPTSFFGTSPPISFHQVGRGQSLLWIFRVFSTIFFKAWCWFDKETFLWRPFFSRTISILFLFGFIFFIFIRGCNLEFPFPSSGGCKMLEYLTRRYSDSLAVFELPKKNKQKTKCIQKKKAHRDRHFRSVFLSRLNVGQWQRLDDVSQVTTFS